MKLFYSAFFTPDEDNGSCHVVFPDLEYECDISADTPETLSSLAAEELGFALWMLEDSGQRLPLPKTISKNEIPDGASIAIVPIDYSSFKKHLLVKVLDLSD